MRGGKGHSPRHSEEAAARSAPAGLGLVLRHRGGSQTRASSSYRDTEGSTLWSLTQDSALRVCVAGGGVGAGLVAETLPPTHFKARRPAGISFALWLGQHRVH